MDALDTFIQSDLEDMFNQYVCSFDIKPMTLVYQKQKYFQQHSETGDNKSHLFVSSQKCLSNSVI